MSRTALIVEDEKDTGDLLGEHLRRWGFDPAILNEGRPVVSWVRQNKPDLILLDLLLPGVDGFTICESLKLERETNLIPIIMITALTAPEDKVHGLQVGANRYLTKPFTGPDLHKAIEEVFEWREQIQKAGTEGEIHFRMQSDTRYLEELNHLLGSLFLFSGLSEKQAKQLTTAVCEMGTNAIEWGHKKQIERIVTVLYRIDPDKITITVRDTGPGFNPQNLPHAADPEDPVRHTMVRETLGMREGGFGILMSQGLVDDMQYNEAGNEVRLVKYFPVKAHLRKNGNGQPAAPGAE
jgi:CheY-like chemotaxis protein/anti-sigma regulatory factor (Ser/Thr protein kinase)